jgi:hypothetical protein
MHASPIREIDSLFEIRFGIQGFSPPIQSKVSPTLVG